MNIPNYDCKDKPTNFKQLYPYLPKETFRMSLASPSGGGKTDLLYHIIMTPLVYYDQIHLYAKNLEQDKYQQMIKAFDGIGKNIEYDPLVYSNDNITPVEDLIDEVSQKNSNI